jgi:excisionase family DNA binding protein
MTRKADPLEALLTIEETAKLLKTSVKTVRRRIKSGDLPVVRDERIVRIRPDDLRRYIVQRWHG